MDLTREQILAAAAGGRRREKVSVPELGGDAYVQVITAAQRERWEDAFVGKAAHPRIVRPLLVAMAACDGRGVPLFTEDDVHAIAGLPITVVEPLFDAAVRINKVAAADVEKLEGESEASRSNGSPSASPSPSGG
jgi:hypothetical protein